MTKIPLLPFLLLQFHLFLSPISQATSTTHRHGRHGHGGHGHGGYGHAGHRYGGHGHWTWWTYPSHEPS